MVCNYRTPSGTGDHEAHSYLIQDTIRLNSRRRSLRGK
ncbi:hypothetical protein VPUCM_0608 [Vibrio parahaemolyticus UCM-V493]|nr:hypothetical protein VPUCM_0608 [Vibrio parahaemolyticus UCM-V493]